MSMQAVIVLKNGRTILGINYRMPAYAPPQPWVPASPAPFIGGYFHFQTQNGWVEVATNDIQTIQYSPGMYQ